MEPYKRMKEEEYQETVDEAASKSTNLEFQEAPPSYFHSGNSQVYPEAPYQINQASTLGSTNAFPPSYQPQAGTTVILTQPVSGSQYPQHQTNHVPDYSVAAWLSCIFCAWPCGLVAILKSQQAKTHRLLNDYDGASKYSRTAKYAIISSVCFGVIIWVGVVLRFALLK